MKKYALDYDFYEMKENEIRKIISDSPSQYKADILAFMRRFPHSAFTSQPVIDVFTGEEVGPADNQITDGEFIWYESWIYHFEKYNLKLNEEFVQHVLSKEDPRSGSQSGER